MDSIIAFGLRLSGLGWLWDKLDGYKTKIGAAGLMMAGGGMMLAGAAQIVSAYAGCADHACQVALARGLGENDSAALALKGFITFKAGLLGLGIRHAIEKSDAAPSVVINAPAPVPETP